MSRELELWVWQVLILEPVPESFPRSTTLRIKFGCVRAASFTG